jgi:Tfp pilus assembly protein PilN
VINLLPQKEKELLKLEVKKKMILIIWLLFLFFLLCFTLILLSIKFYLNGEADLQKVFIREVQNKQQQAEFSDIQKKIENFNQTLNKISIFYGEKVYFSQAVERVINLLPKDAYLTDISMGVLPGDEGSSSVRVALSGMVSTRESLFDFKKNVESQKGITSVSLPPSDWIKAENLNFFMTFNIAN